MRTEPVPEDAVFVFAHQDDEIGALTRLRWEVARGSRVWCCYLTDGASAVAASVRDRESLVTLERAGVERARVGFLGDPERIADGNLPFETPRALRMLAAWAAAIQNVARIYVLDWEGGHHDHDAANVVAAAFARQRGAPDVMVYSMYNGWRRPSGWFRVTSLIPAPGAMVRRRLSLWEALRPVFAILGYPSQRRTWLGLGPGLALRAIVAREERLRKLDTSRLAARPHPGQLLYEKLFNVSAERVLDSTAELRGLALSGGKSP
jgi:LmbE family N-acetylglucosaminyl deacetylase